MASLASLSMQSSMSSKVAMRPQQARGETLVSPALPGSKSLNGPVGAWVPGLRSVDSKQLQARACTGELACPWHQLDF